MQKFTNFVDLADHYAETIASPDYGSAMMEHSEFAQLSIANEPTSAEMPDPDMAQAAIELMMATCFDLFRGTRLEEFSGQVAWGVCDTFRRIAQRIDGQADDSALKVKDLIGQYDPSEVYANQLEEATMRARSLDEARDAFECLRDHAMAIYHAETGRPFSSPRGSLVSSRHSASVVDSRDFLAGRAQRRREQYAPEGPVVVFSGGQNWADTADIDDTLDCIRARIPSMILATTAQNKGADVIAQAWAARRKVKVILCRPETARYGNRAAFMRNDRMISFNPVEAVICSGSGIQANLADKLRDKDVPLHILRIAQQAAA